MMILLGEVKINYSEDDWELLIKDQLDRRWPIIYRGYSDDSGHAWNIDGYEDSFTIVIGAGEVHPMDISILITLTEEDIIL